MSAKNSAPLPEGVPEENPNTVCFRVEPVKRQGANRRYRHNARLAAVEHADPARRHLNRDWLPEVRDLPVGKRLQDQYRKLGCAPPARNANVMAEVIITTSRRTEDPARFLGAAIKWVHDTYPGLVIAMWSHEDEKCLHLHAFVVPVLTVAVKPSGRPGKTSKPTVSKPVCSYSQYFAGKTSSPREYQLAFGRRMSKYQDSLAAAVGCCGLVRGIHDTGREHVPPQSYHLRNDSIDGHVADVRRLAQEDITNAFGLVEFGDPSLVQLLTVDGRRALLQGWKDRVLRSVDKTLASRLTVLSDEAKKGAQLRLERKAVINLGKANAELRAEIEHLRGEVAQRDSDLAELRTKLSEARAIEASYWEEPSLKKIANALGFETGIPGYPVRKVGRVAVDFDRNVFCPDLKGAEESRSAMAFVLAVRGWNNQRALAWFAARFPVNLPAAAKAAGIGWHSEAASAFEELGRPESDPKPARALETFFASCREGRPARIAARRGPRGSFVSYRYEDGPAAFWATGVDGEQRVLTAAGGNLTFGSDDARQVMLTTDLLRAAYLYAVNPSQQVILCPEAQLESGTKRFLETAGHIAVDTGAHRGLELWDEVLTLRQSLPANSMAARGKFAQVTTEQLARAAEHVSQASPAPDAIAELDAPMIGETPPDPSQSNGGEREGGPRAH